MTRKKWMPLALLGAAVLLLGAALLALHSQNGDEADTDAPLCPLAAEEVDRVEYTFAGDTLCLVKDAAGTWSLTDDPALPLAQATVQQTAAGLAGLVPTSALGSGADVAAMGFDEPTAQVTLSAGDESYSFTVGAVNGMTDSYYLRPDGEETVYTVSSIDFSGLCKSRRALYAAQTLNDLDADALTEMTVQSGGKTLELVRSGDVWQLKDDPGFALDQDRVQRMANTACGLKTEWTVTAPEADAAYGLDAPNATVTVTDGKTTWTARFGADAGDDSCYLAADDAPGLVFEVLRQHREAFACTRQSLAAAAEKTPEPTPTPAPETDPVEAMMQSMTTEQKIGQLFFVRPDALDVTLTQEEIDDPYADGVRALTDDMRDVLAKYPVGGIALFKKNITDPEQLPAFLNDLQAASDVPLFLGIDEEGGAVSRLANHPEFITPQYASAAAVGEQGEAAAREMGQSIGAYLKQYGFNVDFAPVADVNSNPDNPVIGTRAFSDDAQKVADLAAAMAEGLQGEGILPVFKHFPGHGDTAEDSHFGLATVHKTRAELEGCEWLPYGWGTRPPLEQGSYAVMVGHLAVPDLTGDTTTPATMSSAIVTDILKKQLYDPLVITDSLAMQAITDQYDAGTAAVRALQAGCDVLLMPAGLAEAYEGVAAAVRDGTISAERLDESVEKILRYKAQYGIL